MIYPHIIEGKTCTDRYNRCPECGSPNIRVDHGDRSMLDGKLLIQTMSTCKECFVRYTWEYRAGVAWYVRGKLVLKGLPNCTNNYVLKCSLCKATRVELELREFDGVTKLSEPPINQ